MSRLEQGRRQPRARAARVPGLDGARLAVWLALAGAVAVAGVDPADPIPPVLVADASGCRLDRPGAAAPCSCAELTGSQRRLFGWPIPLNEAAPEDLSALPGIGPVRAAELVADRERRGRFERIEDLLRVRGIGPRSVEALRSAVFLAGPDPACSAGLGARAPAQRGR